MTMPSPRPTRCHGGPARQVFAAARMRSWCKSLALLLACSTAWAASPAQRLLSAQSEILFVSHQMGVPVEGRFRQFEAQLAFDTRQPERSQIHFQVDLGSATLGARETDAELGKPEWFHTARFPQALFDSSAVRKLAPGLYEVAGTLSIKGVSLPLRFPVTLTQGAGATLAMGSFTLKRLSYHIGEKEWSDTSLVADDVQVRFKLGLSGLDPL